MSPLRPHSTLMLRFLVASMATPAVAGLPSTPDWIGEINLADELFGHDVCAAGDVNGDGYSDALVTTPWVGDGTAYVFLGGPTGLDTDVYWQVADGSPGSQFGISGSTAGDVNGDGYDDVIVGCWGWTNDQVGEGAAFVYHGGPSGPAATPSWQVESDVEVSSFGESVGWAGDVNGDGYDDVIVGAYELTNGQTKEGKAFVYFGSFGGLSPTPNWTYETDVAHDAVGHAVYGAGDVNGDGFGDVIVGGPGVGSGGAAFIFHGSPSGPSATPDRTLSGPSASAFGRAVGTAGDVNGDGYCDVIVGGRNYSNGQSGEGAAWVYLGSASGISSAAAWVQEGGRADALFGHAVRTAGDVNGDGYAEILIGARNYNTGLAGAGRAYMYYGGPTGPDTILRWFYSGSETDAHMGNAVSALGDVNGDGLGDIIVSAPDQSNGENDEGLAFAFYGQHDAPVPYPPKWTIDGSAENENVGSRLNYAGDVNGDGLGDFVAGTNVYSVGIPYRGIVRVFHGDESGSPVFTTAILGNQDTELVGTDVDGAGDVNGDGYEDIIFGAPYYDGGLADVGRAAVHYGSPTGISPATAWQVVGTQSASAFGASVSGAGDVNCDGYADVLVGAMWYTNGQTQEGAAYLYYGSPTGPSATPDWSYESNIEDAWFGDVQGVGDLNGDGFADIAVGAVKYSDSHSTEGGIFVFYGSAGGPSSTPDHIFTSNQLGTGMSVSAPAGDVNGDGYDDFIYAADNMNGDAGVLVGRIWIHFGSPTGISSAADVQIEGESHNENLGYSLDTAGDVNGDGYSDIIAGANEYSGSFPSQGMARIYLGSPSGPTTPAVFEAVTEQDGSRMGTAVCTVGDLNGDGFSDVLSGAPQYDGTSTDAGRLFLYLGGSYYRNEGGLSMRPRQTRFDGTPLPLGARTPDGDRMQLHIDARSAMGRTMASVEWQMVADGGDIDTAPINEEPFVDTGTPGATGSVMPTAVDVLGLTGETPYQWRLRLSYDNVFQPRTRWMALAPAVSSMVAFKTGDAALSAAGAAVLSRPQLAIRPNPMRATASISFTLAAAGAARVSIVDVAGREIALVDESARGAGTHTVAWDGVTNGLPAPAGIYFARVATDAGVLSEKLIRLP